MRNADNDPGETRVGRDPDELEREAEAVAGQEAELAREVAQREQTLTDATNQRTETEQAHQREDARLAALVRAAADRTGGPGPAHRPGQLAAQPGRGCRRRARPPGHGPRRGGAAGRASQQGVHLARDPGRRPGRRGAGAGLRARGGPGGEGSASRAELAGLRTEERAATQERAGADCAAGGAAGRAATARTPPAALLAATDTGRRSARLGGGVGHRTATVTRPPWPRRWEPPPMPSP